MVSGVDLGYVKQHNLAQIHIHGYRHSQYKCTEMKDDLMTFTY